MENMFDRANNIFSLLDNMPINEKIVAINTLKVLLTEHSPFKNEPIDCIQWVPCTEVQKNDYNPNAVAPPEMELLRTSIMHDGYTQPIVTNFEDEHYTVIDGFHRSRVGKECDDVKARVYGYLPIVQIKQSQTDRSDRMAATIRHNRARGTHKVEAMSDIVVELKRRFWSDEKISRELGMEPDEVLRLQQVTGLSSVFADREFSEAWEAESFSEVEEIDEDEV
jgi:ParB-like chromosome segregation protein Spo0J